MVSLEEKTMGGISSKCNLPFPAHVLFPLAFPYTSYPCYSVPPGAKAAMQVGNGAIRHSTERAQTGSRPGT